MPEESTERVRRKKFKPLENWKHFGALFAGIAALLSTFLSIYGEFKPHMIEKEKQSEEKKEELVRACVNDPDGWVNLRKLPDVNSEIIAKINNGFFVEILGKEKNWFFVKTHNNKTGYIYFDRLEIQN
jgi:uncharacterized protein YgiM (DUF1202 family)